MPVEISARRKQRQERELKQRDELLKAAGISPERRMRLLNKAFTELEGQMDAMKSIATKEGIVEVVDNQARLRAIETTLDFEGVSLGKHNEQQQGDRSVQVVINAPYFAVGPTISSGEGSVIEGASTKPLITQESE